MVVPDRHRLTVLAIAFFCVFAIAITAATLGSAVVVESANEIPPDDDPEPIPPIDPPEGNDSLMPHPPGDGSLPTLTVCVEPLNSSLGMLGYFGVAGLVFYAIYRRFSASVAMLSGYALSPFVLVGYFLLTACAARPGDDGSPLPIPSPGDGPGIMETLPAPEISPLVVAAIFGVALIGAVVMVAASGRSESVAFDAESDGEEELENGDVSDLGLAAGRAADRIEANADVDNEVYRAWYEMVRLVDVADPETSTPGEFAAAAISIGVSRTHVDELTRLFEEVRYGDRSVEVREQPALSLFREIEAEYTEVETERLDGTDGDRFDETDADRLDRAEEDGTA